MAYERPALSKAYLFPDKPARLPGFHTCVGGGGDRQDEEWYEKHGIEYITQSKVTEVDVKGKSLLTQTGSKFTFDKLIVATGARPVTLHDLNAPGANLQGIHYLRNVRDADCLIAGIHALKEAGKTKALCIGGGYIGMECAAVLQMNGLDVTMVFPESRLFERLFTPEIAEFYEKFYEDKGITLLKGALCKTLRGEDGHVRNAVLSDGRSIDCDLVVVGIGAKPNVEIFTGQLELLSGPPGGVKVDSHLMASEPDVWAMGDVAAYPQQLEGGKLTRQEHVQNCRESAAYAMASAMGEKLVEYTYLPYFYSRVFSLSWQFYGLPKGEVVHFGDQSTGKFGAFWVESNKIVGGLYEGGNPEEFAALKSIVAKQPEASGDLSSIGLSLASSI